MPNSREKILTSIRQKLDGAHTERSRDQAQSHLSQRTRHTIPNRCQMDAVDLPALFISQAESAGATITLVNRGELEKSLRDYFYHHTIKKIKMADTQLLRQINWQKFLIEASTGPATIHDTVSVTECLCAVAETGTLVLTSSATSPTTLNFLAEIHIVIVEQNNLVPCYEDAWDKVRALSKTPRCVNFITGPSRTGDIEQKILMGAHGPRELQIFLITK